jgi:hypothetical protein
MAWIRRKVVWTGILIVCTVVPAASQFREPQELRTSVASESPTCDSARIDPDSYALTTRAQASIVTQDRLDWWDGFNVGTAFDALHELNGSSTWAAERALELDPDNLLAHAILARQYVVIGEDARRAEDEWRTTLDHGGAVVWTATLYDVDTKSYFVVAFDREALRVYRFGELAGRFDTHLGMPQFPGGDRERLWRAWGGCIDAAARPEAVIPWADVREIKAGNRVLYFKLKHKVRITSDRGKKSDLDEIKVNLHGASGSVEVHTTRDPIDPWKLDVRTMGIGPLAYQERVRRTLVAFVDPDNRIAMPKASRSAGW